MPAAGGALRAPFTVWSSGHSLTAPFARMQARKSARVLGAGRTARHALEHHTAPSSSRHSQTSQQTSRALTRPRHAPRFACGGWSSAFRARSVATRASWQRGRGGPSCCGGVRPPQAALCRVPVQRQLAQAVVGLGVHVKALRDGREAGVKERPRGLARELVWRRRCQLRGEVRVAARSGINVHPVTARHAGATG